MYENLTKNDLAESSKLSVQLYFVFPVHSSRATSIKVFRYFVSNNALAENVTRSEWSYKRRIDQEANKTRSYADFYTKASYTCERTAKSGTTIETLLTYVKRKLNASDVNLRVQLNMWTYNVGNKRSEDRKLNVLPTTIDIVLEAKEIELSRLNMFLTEIDYGGGNRGESSYNVSAFISDVYADLSSNLNVVQGKELDTSRHKFYEITVIALPPSSHNARDFVRLSSVRKELMHNLIRPRDPNSDIDEERQAEVLNKNYSFLSKLYCNFTVRTALIVYNEDSVNYRRYAEGFLDVFRSVRAVWSRVTESMFSLDVNYLNTLKGRTSKVFREIKTMYATINTPKIEYEGINAAKIYKELFKDALQEFGIADALGSLDFVTRVNDLFYTRAANSMLLSNVAIGILLVLVTIVLASSAVTRYLGTVGLILTVLLDVIGGLGIIWWLKR